MDCNKTREKTHEYVDNELNSSEKKEIEEHLNSCIECKKEIIILKNYKEMINSIEKEVLPENFNNKLNNRIKNTRSIKKKFYTKPLIAVAIFIIIIVAVINPFASKDSYDMIEYEPGINKSKILNLKQSTDSVTSSDSFNEIEQSNINLSSDSSQSLSIDEYSNEDIDSEYFDLNDEPSDYYIEKKMTTFLSLNFEIDNIDEFYKKINAISNKNDVIINFYEKYSIDNKSYISLSLKVPTERKDAFILELRTLGKIKNESILNTDITNQYYDAKRSVDTLEKQLKVFNELLSNTIDTEEKISALSTIASLEIELQYANRNMEYQDMLVDYAEVSINAEEKSGEYFSNMGYKMSDSIDEIKKDTANFIGKLPYIMYIVMIFAIIIFILILSGKYIYHKIKK